MWASGEYHVHWLSVQFISAKLFLQGTKLRTSIGTTGLDLRVLVQNFNDFQGHRINKILGPRMLVWNGHVWMRVTKHLFYHHVNAPLLVAKVVQNPGT